MLVSVERSGHVATLWLDRAASRNALSVALCEELTRAISGLDSDDEVRAIALRGRGSVFCAGADFGAVAGPDARRFITAFEELLETVANCERPTVAAVHGAALGGGLQLAVACDFRVVTRDARLGVPAARLGVVVNLENVERLVALTGPGPAREILLAAVEVVGEEALRMGLATRLCETEELDDRVADFMSNLAELAPLSVRGMKRAIYLAARPAGSVRREAPEEASAFDDLLAGAYGSEDLQEGLAAMREKRPARWRGR